MKRQWAVGVAIIVALGLLFGGVLGLSACGGDSSAALPEGAVGVVINFALKDEVKAGMDQDGLREHLGHLIEEYKKVPGLIEKSFYTNPANLDQGAFLVFESEADWNAYMGTPLYKEAVLDICEGEPDIHVYVITATLKDGVLF